LYDTNTLSETTSFKVGEGEITSVLFAPPKPGQPLLISCASTKGVSIWNVHTGKKVKSWGSAFSVKAQAFGPVMPEFPVLLAFPTDHEILLWDIYDNHLYAKVHDVGRTLVSSLAVSGDLIMAMGTDSGPIKCVGHWQKSQV
jgi:WD40 repeat protein